MGYIALALYALTILRQWLREELRHHSIASRTVASVLLVEGVALRPQAAGRQVEND